MTTGYDTQRVTTADNVGISFRVAGLATRIAAALLDGLILACILVVATLLIFAIADAAAGGGGGNASLVVFSLASYLLAAAWVLIVVLYFTVGQAVSAGRTPGKAAMGLRVIRVDGAAASLGEYFLRSIALVVDVVVGVGPVLMFFHPQSRRLGDLLAGTVVVRERTPVTLQAATAMAPVYLRSLDPGPPIDGLSHLGEHELAAVRTFLGRTGLRPGQRTELAARLAGPLLERMEIPPGAPERMWPPELLLERLYVQLAPRLGAWGQVPVLRLDPRGGWGWPPPVAP
ncbi:MAG: RDD family protein [Candidatus Dormibacteria bacterium]